MSKNTQKADSGTRNRQKSNRALLNGNNFLAQMIIVSDQEDSKVFCTLCGDDVSNKENWFFYECLQRHITSGDHLKAVIAAHKTEEHASILQYYQDLKKGKKKGASEQAPNQISSNENRVIDAPRDPDFINESLQSTKITNSQEYFQYQVMQFIVQNNLPFNAASKLTMFVKDLLSAHSGTSLLKYKCDDSQVKKYISGAIAPTLKDRYLKELETKPFWIALDEATNATLQYLAISVTFFESSKDLSHTTKLLSVIEVEESVSGQAIYEAVWKLIFEGLEGSRRQRNFIGVVTDGAKSMISTGDWGQPID